MAEKRLQASEKKVQKMTKEGLVETNLSKKTARRISKRLEDAEFTGKHGESKEDAKDLRKEGERKPRSRSPSVHRARLRFSEEERTSKGEPASVRTDSAAMKEKGKRSRVYQEEQKKKKASKLHFEDAVSSGQEDGGMAKKERAIASKVKRSAIALRQVAMAMPADAQEGEEDENAAVDGMKGGDQAVSSAYRFGSRRSDKHQKKQYKRAHKLEQRSIRSKAALHYREHLQSDQKLQDANALKRFIRKQQIKRQYAKAYRAEKAGGEAVKQGSLFMKTASRKVLSFFAEHKGMALSMVALVLLLVVVMNTVTSCSMGALQVLSGTLASSYLSEPEDIEQAELYYTELEAALQKKINEMERAYPGMDAYRYNIGEISHDPHVLISYLSAKYEVFTFEQVKSEIEALFAAQYGLDVEQVKETVEETKTVQVGESLGRVVTSGYCNCTICCGIWSGGSTASGVMPKANHTIAVDASNPVVPMGTKIVMNGVEYTVEDTGNFARYGVSFDVYFDNHAAALAHGHRTWEAFLAEGNEHTVEVTKTETVEALNVTLTARSLQMAVQSRMNEEQKELYGYLYAAKGNLQVYTTPIELNWYAYIKSFYGYRINVGTGKQELHRGVEISVTEGTEVKSGQTGVVANTGYDDHYGHYVVTQDKKGYQLKYGHLQSVQVEKGQAIAAGDVIGKTGSSGSVSGSQLYLELVKDGTYYNPIFYVDTGEGGYGSSGSGAHYDDETVRRLFEEAEKYLGMPYVWGGSSPATSFDCSGFVCYVFSNSGVWNIGRTTAQGIYDQCTPIDPSEAQPGDIIFFTGTYSTSNPVTHVGIYAGDGMMIHCGNPIQYASIHSPYWQQHFYAFGRPAY